MNVENYKMSNRNKIRFKYGIRGTIEPKSFFNEVNDCFDIDGIFHIENRGGDLEVSFNDKDQESTAKDIVDILLLAFSFDKNKKFTINLNTSWEIKDDNTRLITKNFMENVHVKDTFCITSVVKSLGLTYVVKPLANYSLCSSIGLFKKARKQEALRRALRHLMDESLDQEKPFYGIYKSFEELKKEAGSRKSLAKLVGVSEKYISQLTDTVNHFRHASNGNKSTLLSKEECLRRISNIIKKYASCVSDK